MCGIAGFIGLNATFDVINVAQKMGDVLGHRGPDSAGLWRDNADGVILVHQRLSILDLSNQGHQPMLSFCGRYALIFNGEIYNHLSIRQDLEKFTNIIWRGHSDTETLLAAFSLWGIQKTLSVISGMFAIALWDRKDKKLFLIRDRMGEKPLYYGFINGHFIFSSEIKAIKCFPGFHPEINKDAFYQYLSLDYIPAPLTIYQNIFKLQPAFCLEYSINSGVANYSYWDLSDIATNSKKELFVDDNSAIEAVKICLQKAVKSQSLSDVPLGVFLSGGIDSTSIAALMQAQSSNPIKTFTVGFENKDFDESSYASAIAKYLGSEHHEYILTSKDCISLLPKLINIYDEPFADSSQIPTYFVSKIASEHVKVVLSGDGGDELFGGYYRYNMVPKAWQKLKHAPFFTRKMIGKILESPSHNFYDKFNNILPSHYKSSRLGEKIQKLGGRLSHVRSINELYASFLVKENKPEFILKNLYPFREPFYKNRQTFIFDNIVDNMMLIDSKYYLPDDILTKVDRASMAHSLEARVPFLDPSLIELAWRVPLHMKIRNNSTKWILRKVLEEYLPSYLINRPKMGFGIPIANWLRGDLCPLVDSLLNKQKMLEQDLFDAEKIQKIWQDHRTCKRDWSSTLWNVAVFQSWYEENF